MNRQRRITGGYWIKSLHGQLIFRIMTCFVIFIMAISVLLYSTIKASLYQSVKTNLIVDAENVTDFLSVWFFNSIPEKSAQLPRDNFLITLDKKFTTQGVTVDFVGEEISLGFAEDWEGILNGLTSNPFVYVSPETHDRYMMYWRHVYAGGNNIPSNQKPTLIGYAVLGMPLEATDRLLDDLLQWVLGVGIIVLAVGLTTMIVVLRRPLQPLQKISATAEQIASGRYDLRLSDKNGPSEIVLLRDTLNHMLDELDQALRTEKMAREEMARFIADASHELRTPLTSLQGFLEILPRNTHEDPQVLHEVYATMLKETNRLIRLAEALLTLNRLTQSSIDSEAEGKAIVCRGVMSSYNNAVRELRPVLIPLLQDRVLDWPELPEEIAFDIPMTMDQFKHIILNLVANAIQHTPPNGMIRINAHTVGAGMLTISDNGSGIAPEDQPHIFERFFRSDPSRTHTSGNERGSGLGLAIVSEIARLCGGSICVSSTLGKGTTFVITFAAADIVPEALTRLYASMT